MSVFTLEEYEELIDARLAESSLLQERLDEARANYERGEGSSYEALRRELLVEAEETDMKSSIVKIWEKASGKDEKA